MGVKRRWASAFDASWRVFPTRARLAELPRAHRVLALDPGVVIAIAIAIATTSPGNLDGVRQ